MKRAFFLLALVLTFSSCKDKTTFSVKGVIKNTKEKYIYLNRLEVNTPVKTDSAKIAKDGSFRIKVKASSADFYEVGVSPANFITLLAEPGEKIDLLFNSGNLYENYTIRGSEGSKKLQMLDMSLADTKRKLDSLSLLYSQASATAGSDTKKLQLESDYNDLIQAQRKKNIEFIINNLNSLASIKALYQRINPQTYVLYDQKDLQYLKIVTDSLTRHYPKSKQVQALLQDFKEEMGQMYASQLGQLVKSIPLTRLDPNLMTTEGKRIALSSLKGKYVLLTFWSFQSKDCVAENLDLKEFYKQYNKKGFEIYQINLDPDEKDWLGAVKFDELPWISAREDDPNNPRNAILYNVKSVPANFLYDKDNNIIATDLHGRSLQLKLSQLFNK
jgi:thiol-disulfide isomerase/thioredoxin